MTPKRITVVTAELLGFDRTAGAGTAMTFLALALARMGHRVDVLYAGKSVTKPLEPEWAGLCEQAGITVSVAPHSREQFTDPLFARAHGVELALRENPPDVVITHEFWAPAYTALCLRGLGLAFEDTLFVVVCHGSWLWVKEMNRNVRIFRNVLRQNVLEQKSVECADVVVSPSAYLLGWMQDEGWQLPDASHVIPYVTRSVALEEPQPRAPGGNGAVERLAFFGRLEERKGLTPFLAGVNSLPPELLAEVELEFIGKATAEWAPDRVQALLSETARRSIRRISFETGLDQHEALARLGRRGTLAVMPSLGDNSPNTVYECLERGIPFIASDVGGIPELIAAEDRARVLFKPTARGVADAVRRALQDCGALHPARPAHNGVEIQRKWADVVAQSPRRPHAPASLPAVDVVVGRRSSRPPEPTADAAWVLFLEEEDVPDPELAATLLRAQAASGADVVTCGAYVRGEDGGRTRRVFVGEPGGLGLLENGYGYAPLVRRSLLDGLELSRPVSGDDPDWPLLAALDARGARIVSVPLPLVTRTAPPPTLDTAADALLVVEELERVLPGELRSLARLAAGLAADRVHQPPASEAGLARRARSVLRRSLRGRALTQA